MKSKLLLLLPQVTIPLEKFTIIIRINTCVFIVSTIFFHQLQYLQYNSKPLKFMIVSHPSCEIFLTLYESYRFYTQNFIPISEKNVWSTKQFGSLSIQNRTSMHYYKHSMFSFQILNFTQYSYSPYLAKSFLLCWCLSIGYEKFFIFHFIISIVLLENQW